MANDKGIKFIDFFFFFSSVCARPTSATRRPRTAWSATLCLSWPSRTFNHGHSGTPATDSNSGMRCGSTKDVPTCSFNLLRVNPKIYWIFFRMEIWLRNWSSTFQGLIQWRRWEDLTNLHSTSRREFSNTNFIRTWKSNNLQRYLSLHYNIPNINIQF